MADSSGSGSGSGSVSDFLIRIAPSPPSKPARPGLQCLGPPWVDWSME